MADITMITSSPESHDPTAPVDFTDFSGGSPLASTQINARMGKAGLEKAHADIANQFSKPSIRSAAKRIRIISTFISDDVNFFTLATPFAESYTPYYRDLLASKPVSCAVTGTVFEAVSPPVAIIMDFFALPQLLATRAITGRSIPVTAFISTGAASAIRLFGPESLGGLGDFGAKIDAEVARTGRDPLEIGEEIFKGTNGTVLEIPGLPPMYDYESFPQQSSFSAPMSPIARKGYVFFQECDAVIIMTCKAYDSSGSLDAFKSWFSEGNKACFGIGPLLPLGYGTEETSSRGDSAVEVFLGDMLKQYDEKSVTFISFGTIFWPASLDYVEEVIEAFIEQKAPFVFCHASPFAQVSSELIDKVNASGLGYTSKWAPQQYILSHPATGWFLTHCGAGGVTEALGNCIPMICWPFDADQPGTAAHLSENLNVAIELIEVRTGEHATKPMLRHGRAAKGTRKAVGIEIRGVIKACRGKKGAELRANAQRLKKEYAQSWEEGGDGRSELQTFLQQYVPLA